MYHLSDKELDRLSQEAAEQYDVEATTSGWDALEKKLTVEMPLKEKRRRRFLLFLLAAAIITGGSLFLILTPDVNQLEGPVKNSQSAPAADKASTRVRDNSSAVHDNKSDETVKSNSSIDNPSNSGKSNGNDQPLVTSDKSTANNLKKNNADKNANQITQGNSSSPRNSVDKNSINNQIVSAEIKSVGDHRKKSASRSNRKQKELSPQDYVIIDMLSQTQPEPTVRVENIMEKALRNAHVKGVSNAGNINTSAIQPGDQNIALSSTTQAATRNRSFWSGFEFGALVAPDISSVQFKNSGKLGFNVGATINYRFSNRWSLQTGLIYTRKMYTAAASDYHPPKGSWTYSIDLDKVEGDCYMWDIPLNIRYDLNTNTRNRFFVSGGLSSYLMKKETYDYYYTYNGVYDHREKSYVTHLNHWFNIMNVSGGFEHSFNRKFSLQLEPYVKIPLQGIGFGSVDLSSYGIYFSLRYKPHW
jgi:hypothetical protein